MAMHQNVGKFDNALDEALYAISLDGADDEVGSSTEAPGTWGGLMRDGAGLAKRIEDDRGEFPNVTSADVDYVRTTGVAGAIITENTQGFVKVAYYKSEADLEKDWDELCEDLRLEGDDEDEGDDDELTRNGDAKSSGFSKGDRIETHPATDAWMSGDRFGEIVKVGRDKLHVKMDRSGRTRKFLPRDIAHIDHRPNTTIADRRKAGIIEGLTKEEVDSMEIRIPTFDWKQVGGDMNPGAYGGIIARADGDSIEMIEIQPVRESVGDREAKDVGHPFWSKEGTYSLSDLSLGDENVQSAIEYTGLGEVLLELTPERRAIAIAEACLQAGHGSDEGPAGWAEDVVGSRVVEWSGGKTEDWHYLEDEDKEFRREVLGEKYEVLVNGDSTDRFYEDEDDAISDAKEKIERGMLIGRVEVVDTFDDEIIWSSDAPTEEEDPGDLGKLEPNSTGALQEDADRWFDLLAAAGPKVRHIGGVRELDRIAGMSPSTKNFELFKQKLSGMHSDWGVELQAFIRNMEAGKYDRDFRRMAGTKRQSSQIRSMFDSFQSAFNYQKNSGAHRRNAPMPELERSGVLDQLIEMEAESMEPRGSGRVPREVKNALTVTPALREVVSEYEDALAIALDEGAQEFPPLDGSSGAALFADNAPYLVLMTLRGEGVGIWDGDWDEHYDDTKPLGEFLERKLHRFADSTGSGRISEALQDAVYEAMRETGYTFDDETYVKGDIALALSKNRHSKNPQVRWHVFLNGEIVDTVYFDKDMGADEVRRALVDHDGYDAGIEVRQPPARRTNLPPDYRLRSNRAHRR
jgi:hypothetical protein